MTETTLRWRMRAASFPSSTRSLANSVLVRRCMCVSLRATSVANPLEPTARARYTVAMPPLAMGRRIS